MTGWRLALNVLAIAALWGPLAIALAALSGIGHRWVDILAQFTAPVLMATVAGVAVAALLRLWPTVIAGLAVALLLAVAVAPQWFPAKGRPQPGAPTITLYSANTYVRNQDADAIRASIEQARPDIVILVEFAEEPDRRIDEVLAGFPHRYLNPVTDGPGGRSRTLVASRWPLRGERDRPDELDAVTAVVETPLGPVNVVGVHLTRPWPYQYQWGQIIQTMNLTDILRGRSGPVIVAGDFNSVSSARIGRQVKKDIGLVPAPGFPGTWPSGLPAFVGMTIDQVYHSPDLAVLDRRLGRPNGSDHRPVVTRFTRAAPGR